MTRTLKISAIALLGVFVLWACGGELGPKETGEKFLNAINSGDFSGAQSYGTKETNESLKVLAEMPGAGSQGENATLEFGELTENGDNASLAYKKDGKDMTLELKKEDGSWKAIWAKTDMGGGGDLGGALDGAMDAAGDAMEKAMDELGEALEDVGATTEEDGGEE